MDVHDKHKHSLATECYQCGNEFSEKQFKVADHDHVTGRYRGAACTQCNWKMRLTRTTLPVVFHNLRGYDMHGLCTTALGKMKDWELYPIAQTKEKYMALYASFPVDKEKEKTVMMKLQFIDSFQHLGISLERLVGMMQYEDMHLTRDCGLPEGVIKRKGIFPYSYFDSIDRLEETTLPPREAFRNSLTGELISEEDYKTALEAWDLLDCKTFGEYMLNYLMMDVHQLADVFEYYRKVTMQKDGIDPAHYISLPQLSLDSALKMTSVKAQLIVDESLYRTIEHGIRGGMTFVNRLLVEAEMGVDMLYVDANNLYGNALSQKLPYGGWRELTREEIESMDPATMDLDGDKGYLFVVDLNYPPHVQDASVDLPYAPQRMTVTKEMLTEEMKAQWEHVCQVRYGKEKPYRGYPKLVLDQFVKEEYVIHGKLLQFFLEQGMVITKIHTAYQFDQAAIFEPYITYNSRRRQEATNDFHKEF